MTLKLDLKRNTKPKMAMIEQPGPQELNCSRRLEGTAEGLAAGHSGRKRQLYRIQKVEDEGSTAGAVLEAKT